MDPHRLAELRSLAYHQEVALRLRRDPQLLGQARDNLARWLAAGGRGSDILRRWQEILERPIAEICERLVDPGAEAQELRHASPFAGALGPRERWQIWRQVRAAAERSR